MHRSWTLRGSAIALIGAFLATPARPYDLTKTDTVPDEIRNSSQPIDMEIIVPQDGMSVQYVPELDLNPVMNQGLVGNLIERMLNKGAKKREIAQGQIFQPALEGVNVTDLAMKAAHNAFTNIPWLKPTKAQSDNTEKSVSGTTTRAALVFEYAIDPNIKRVFVGCSLHISRTVSESSEGTKASKPREISIYKGINQSTIEIVGLPTDKQERTKYFLEKEGSHLKKYLAETLSDCTRLAARSASYRPEDIRNIVSQKPTTISTHSNEGWKGWLLEGRENLIGGKYGPLGIGKTFVQTRTNGAILFAGSSHTGLFHLSTVDPE